MPSIDILLDRLDGVKKTGDGRWMAKSPCRKERTASLSIRLLDDGRILLHDFGGDSAVDVLAAIGLTLNDLYPDRQPENSRPRERRPFLATDALRAVSFEALVVCAAASALVSGGHLPTAERERLLLAAERIQSALSGAGL